MELGRPLFLFLLTFTLVRSQALVGEESCLQIFSVPRKSVVCEPSAEVKASLQEVKDSTVKLGEDIGVLSGRLDEIDPNVEKELPEEVKQRLAEIEELKLSHAAQVEAIKRIEESLKTSSQRLVNLEESNREEIGRVLEQQVTLIQMTLEKSNSSLHREYVDQLTRSTQDLIARLQTLELDLKDLMHSSDGELRSKLESIQEASHSEISEVKTKLEEAITEVSDQLQSDQAERLFHFNLSSSHSGQLEVLRTVLTSIRENQAKALEERGQINRQVSSLNTQMTTVEQTSSESLDKTATIESALEQLKQRMNEVSSGLLQCENQTGELVDKLTRLKEVVDKTEHMLPRTLKKDTKGWTVIQRRQNGTVDFFKGWSEYKDGFGDVHREYWLGLQHIHTMTSQRNYSLRVDVEDWEGKWKYAEYATFRVASEEQNYTLHLSGYHGDAGDALSFHDGMAFSTMDRNHDNNNGICAAMCHGAWWYDDCYHSNLNGRYYHQGNYLTNTGWGDGIVWRTLTQSNYYSLKTVTMKIAPKDIGTS